jgi:EAL domain-containing protein (putative c-di-GMP-specific phosphodiesterase class I)
MPLSEFVRYLNAQHPLPASWLHSTTPFVARDGHVFVHFANLRLESRFSPIVDTASGKLCGHAAGLHAVGLRNHQLLEPEAIFVLASDDEEFSYLDRLVRTLHALNYLTHLDRHSRGTLLLRVHPRHVASVVADHGLAFEEVLRACGLLPEQIMLEIEIDGVDDAAHLVQAVANYRSRGYGIAIGRFGRREINYALLQEIRPAIVKFDPLLLVSARSLQPMVDQVRELGALLMIEGVDAAVLRKDAREGGFDLLQVHTPLRSLRHASAVG